MANPIAIDIPHNLSPDQARQKLDAGVGQIAGIVPGGSLRAHRWEGNTLHFEIQAMGQCVCTRLEVFEDRIHAIVELPPMAALFASTIRTKLKQMGTKLLGSPAR